MPAIPPSNPGAAAEGAGRSYVWWCKIDDYRLSMQTSLSPVETFRADRFQRVEDRRRFVLGAAVCRAAIGWLLGVDPPDVHIDRRCPRCGAPHGRPRLPEAVGLELSVAHAGRLVVVAVRARVRGESGSGRIGVDVEVVRNARSTERLLASPLVLSPAEIEVVRTIAPGRRLVAFLTYWVRKEAVVKATGLGLLTPMSSITLTAPGEQARIIRWEDPPGRIDGMCLRDLAAPPGYLAALAVDGTPGPVIEADATLLLAGGQDCR